jgi:hypothetical protein
MKYLHYDFTLSTSDMIEVSLTKQANVKLMDDINFFKYQRGLQHSYYGGLMKQSPAFVRPPSLGHWHLAIDLGGYPGSVNATVRVLNN